MAQRGKLFELLSDQGTNFKGGSKELHEAFSAMEPSLQEQLAAEQIQFRFSPLMRHTLVGFGKGRCDP